MNLEPPASTITADRVRADCNDINTVLHYTRAALQLGLWASERVLIARYFPPSDRLLELGCGAGRVALGLWELGYRHILAIDFAGELIDQARSLATERGASGIVFAQADVTVLSSVSLRPAPSHAAGESNPIGYFDRKSTSTECNPLGYTFDGAIFAFNGLMQIPGCEKRRQALREIHRACRPGAHLLFTTHDRDDDPRERQLWAEEATRWARGAQDPRLVEFGDRYFPDDHGGMTYMHLPDRAEILADLEATGWTAVFDAMRREIAAESRAVRDFSDECRFWVAKQD